MSEVFSKGDRVRVSDSFFWAQGAIGTIGELPDIVKTLSGDSSESLTREETSALGTHTIYWVSFDEPQLDADGYGPYRAGQIWQEALSRLTIH